MSSLRLPMCNDIVQFTVTFVVFYYKAMLLEDAVVAYKGGGFQYSMALGAQNYTFL